MDRLRAPVVLGAYVGALLRQPLRDFEVAIAAGAVDRLHTPAARLIHGHVLKEESDNVDVAAEASTVNGLVVRAVFFPH